MKNYNSLIDLSTNIKWMKSLTIYNGREIIQTLKVLVKLQDKIKAAKKNFKLNINNKKVVKSKKITMICQDIWLLQLYKLKNMKINMKGMH